MQGFKDGGCFDDMQRRLGYRIELVSATYESIAHRGATLSFTVQLRNVGFAAMFNARPVLAVLSDGTTTHTTQLDVDPRTWAPGVPQTIGHTLVIPPSLPAGTYTLSLWLPDAAASIQQDPRFAVRFANDGVWDGARGYNVIGTNISILRDLRPGIRTTARNTGASRR